MEKKTATKEFEHLGIKGRIVANLFEYYKDGQYTHSVSSYVNDQSFGENFGISHEEFEGYVKELTDLMKNKINDIHQELQKPILSELESLGFEIGGEESVVEGDMIGGGVLEEKGHTNMNSDEEEFDEDHALDMVMNDIVEELGEDEINEIIEETKNNDNVSVDDW